MAANCNYKVKLIGALDMLRFKNMPKVREAAIQAAPATPLPKTFTTNEKAKVRHPEMQRVVVAEIRPNGPDVKTIVLKSEDGAPLAPFRFAFQPFHEAYAEPFGQLRARSLLQRTADYVMFRFHAVAYLPVYTVFCGCGEDGL